MMSLVILLMRAGRACLIVAVTSSALLAVSSAAFGQNMKVTLGGMRGNPGDTVELPVILHNPESHALGEFILAIEILEYDSPVPPKAPELIPSPLQTDCGWEYFYRDVQPGRILIFGKAAPDQGRNCLVEDSILLANLTFEIPYDVEFAYFSTWLGFSFRDCTDNTFITVAGDTFFYSDSVYYPWTDSLAGTGALDTCLAPAEPLPEEHVREILFENGFIASGISGIGDVNLDGITYTIADVVMLQRYFVEGSSVLTIDSMRQIFNSNVNCDEAFPSLADLVYMTRMQTGDIFPRPCTTVSLQTAPFRTVITNDTLSHSVEIQIGGDSVSAVQLTFDGEILPSLLANGPTMHSYFDGQFSRVLVTYLDSLMAAGIKLNISDGALIEYSGTGQVVDAQVADWSGRYPVPAAIHLTYDCCVNSTGNVDNDLFDDVDLRDLMVLVNHLFITFEDLPCGAEADMAVSYPLLIDIQDLTALVNHLFVTFEALPPCH